jgi:fucose 4-O-acetylase-like acetyltransferase
MAFLSIVQKDRNIVTTYGENSLYIYVLHGFLMKGLVVIGLYNYIDRGWKAIILILASLVLLPILSSRYLKFIADNIMNPLGLTNVVLAIGMGTAITDSPSHTTRHTDRVPRWFG